MARHDIKLFIDFFHDTSLRVRKQKAVIVRGKDGKLVARALTIFSRPQLEMLALWFLAKKTKLSPSIGAMLSNVVLEELQRKIKTSYFWKELDELSANFYDKPSVATISRKKQMFSPAEVLELQSKL